MRTHSLSKLSHQFLAIVFLLAFTTFPTRVNQAAPNTQTVAYQEDFENGQAAGWQLEPGWSVVLEGGNHVLAGQGHSWARFDQPFNGDLHISFRVMLLEGVIHLVTRLTGASRYFIGFDAEGSTLNKQYFPDEFQNDLASGGNAYSLNHWYQVEIVFQGSRIDFLVDGVQAWSYTDPQPLLSGTLAFETLDDSKAYVDDIRVQTGTGTPATATQTAPATATHQPAPPSTQLPPASLAWQRLGGPLGGLGYDIRMRAGDPEKMYVTDAWAGVFVSTDGGASWFPSNTGITTRSGPSGDGIPVFSLTLDPNNPDILWIGTQFQRGIFKSIDGGQTWQKRVTGIIESDGITFRGFAVDPNNSNVVYAAAEVSSWAWRADYRPHNGREFDMTEGVIYKTTDGGQYWQAVWRGKNLARYIWINPQNTDTLYISTGFFDREAANSDPVTGTPGGEGILKSTDGGLTWTAVNNGLGNLYVTSLFMHPANPEILLAATGNIQYHDGGGVYRTTNGGASWQRVLSGEYEAIFEAVEISSSDPNIAYAANDQAVYRSQDAGLTWEKVSGGGYWGPAGVRAGFPVDFQVDPRDPDRIFANEYGGGNFLSEDGGRTWVDASHGYTGAQVRDVAVDPAQPGRLLVAARSGIFVSDDGGDEWVGLNYPPVVSMEWNVVAIDPRDTQHILAATNWNGILESHTGGGDWKLVAQLPEARKGWRAIAFAPSDPQTVYAGLGGFFSAGSFDPAIPGGGVFISNNGGRTWLPANDALTQDAHVTCLAVDPLDPHTIFAATINHGLVKSIDGGQNWTQVGGGLSASSAILSVAIRPDDPSSFFVGLDRGAVYKSMDGGQSWERSSSGLNPEASVADIVFDPVNPGGVYLADLQSGVYRSTDSGQRWQGITNGMESRSINALAISADGLHLYAASEGMGVFRLDLNGQAPEPAPDIKPSPTSTPTPKPISLPTETMPPVTNASTLIPTATPGAKPGICGGVAMLPLALLGLICWQASRRRPGK